jgi:hypothetical protein
LQRPAAIPASRWKAKWAHTSRANIEHLSPTMLKRERAAKQHWIFTRPGRLELAGYVAIFIIVFALIYWALS